MRRRLFSIQSRGVDSPVTGLPVFSTGGARQTASRTAVQARCSWVVPLSRRISNIAGATGFGVTVPVVIVLLG